MKWIATLVLLIFQNCITYPSFDGFGNIDSAKNQTRVYFDEKKGKFETLPNFRGNIIRIGDIVLGETKNINFKNQKKRICERNETELIKRIDLIDERTIVAIYETSSYLCIEYY
ncbi:hypothetical protein EHR01_07645 [Leptospira mtsangambouensis]|uniref:Lipoprotein n=1 Tax=Leptospira mtsangambouensis TaxID=2484912 RepID=A0ABY2P0X4_9LEPT|nr:hypothetical protein [Leptospira mtsangambouensis]TGM78324.1 hypothetical protein EHR01_07645 [Leptospira mtsangambouensis]